MPVTQPSLLQLVIGYLKLVVESFLFPIGVVVILYLARRDFRRWVDFQIRSQGQDAELRDETKEFLE